MATGGNAGDAPFMKQAPLPSREGKFYASEGAKILPGSVYPEIHPSKGNVGDAPGMKQSPGEGKLHTVQIWASPASYTGGDPKTLPGLRTLSGDHPEAISGCDHPEAISGCDHPEAISGGGHPDTLSGRGRPDTLAGIDHPTTLAGVGPTIKSGGMMLAGGDPMVAAGYFSKIYTMAVKPPVLIHVPRTLESPVRLESPRDPRITILYRDFVRRRGWASRRQTLKSLNDKGEDNSEKKKLEEDRQKFEDEKKLAFLSLEEERKRFEEYKNQFYQKAAVAEEEKKGTMLSSTVSKLDTADKHFSLVEKVVKVPERTAELVKSAGENKETVKKFLEDNKTRIQKVKQFGKFLATGALGMMREQIRDALGLGGGDAAEGVNDDGVSSGEGNAGGNAPNGALKVANGTGNGPNGVAKVVNGTGNGPNIGGSVPKVASAVNGAPKVSASNATGTGTFCDNDGGGAMVSASTGPVDGAATGAKGEAPKVSAPNAAGTAAVGANAGGPAETAAAIAGGAISPSTGPVDGGAKGL